MRDLEDPQLDEHLPNVVRLTAFAYGYRIVDRYARADTQPMVTWQRVVEPDGTFTVADIEALSPCWGRRHVCATVIMHMSGRCWCCGAEAPPTQRAPRWKHEHSCPLRVVPLMEPSPN
jgi:hypothetical protein